jgi:hypothetical protein
MLTAPSVNHPTIILLMRDQRADADNRVVNVFREFVANLRLDFVCFSVVTIRRSETCEVRNRLNMPYDHVGHVRRLAFTAA